MVFVFADMVRFLVVFAVRCFTFWRYGTHSCTIVPQIMRQSGCGSEEDIHIFLGGGSGWMGDGVLTI
jgi:hypothetical protein